MEKMKMHSPNLTQENIARIRELFPGCVTEARGEDGKLRLAVDFDQLRQELSESIVEGPQERYQLNWPGKREALLIANAPIAKTLRPCREESVDFDTTKNLFIEGDNLEALKLLQETYLGKVKMIYIDPPYNTGNDFIYKDNLDETTEEFLKRSNQKDELGNHLIANLESNGRFHSDWLSMMYPRLKLARNLLREDGVIFISIDDSESERLKLICNEVFGEENYLVTLYIQVRYADKTLAEKNDYQKLIEHIHVYKKQEFYPNKESEDYTIDKFCWQIVEKTSGRSLILGKRTVQVFSEGEYEIKKIEPHINGLKETWATGTVLKANASGKFFQDYIAPRKNEDGLGVLYKVNGIGEDGLGYRYFTGPKRVDATKGKFFSGVPTDRRAELALGDSKKYKPILNWNDYSDAFGNCRHEGGVDFGAGKKPVSLLKKLISMATTNDEQHIVLDFFAGSGTTGHATYETNSEDGGNRRFILVQLPEETGRSDYPTISSMTKQRLRNASIKVKSGNPLSLDDTGFRVLKIAASNMEDVYYTPDDIDRGKLKLSIDNIKSDRTAEDLLFQVLLDLAVDLTLPIVKKLIRGKEVFFVDENALVACFDYGITEEFVKELIGFNAMRVVFRDTGFASDAAKINVEQIFKQLSPGTEVKSI